MLLELNEMYEILMYFFVIVSRLVLPPIQYVSKNNDPKKATKLIIARAELIGTGVFILDGAELFCQSGNQSIAHLPTASANTTRSLG